MFKILPDAATSMRRIYYGVRHDKKMDSRWSLSPAKTGAGMTLDRVNLLNVVRLLKI